MMRAIVITKGTAAKVTKVASKIEKREGIRNIAPIAVKINE